MNTFAESLPQTHKLKALNLINRIGWFDRATAKPKRSQTTIK